MVMKQDTSRKRSKNIYKENATRGQLLKLSLVAQKVNLSLERNLMVARMEKFKFSKKGTLLLKKGI